MKLFMLILILLLSACSSNFEMPHQPKSYLEKGILLLDVISLENSVKFEEIGVSKETNILTSKIFEWSKKKFKSIGKSNQGKLAIENADFAVTQTDNGLLIKAFAHIRLSIYSSDKKKIVDVNISGEKMFDTQSKISSVEKKNLINVLINQLVYSINEEFEKNITDDLTRYIFVNHNQ